MASPTMMKIVTFLRPVWVLEDWDAPSKFRCKYFVVRARAWYLHIPMDFEVVDKFTPLCEASFLLGWWCCCVGILFVALGEAGWSADKVGVVFDCLEDGREVELLDFECGYQSIGRGMNKCLSAAM